LHVWNQNFDFEGLRFPNRSVDFQMFAQFGSRKSKYYQSNGTCNVQHLFRSFRKACRPIANGVKQRCRALVERCHSPPEAPFIRPKRPPEESRVRTFGTCKARALRSRAIPEGGRRSHGPKMDRALFRATLAKRFGRRSSFQNPARRTTFILVRGTQRVPLPKSRAVA
jgi:hypothetical protein